MTRCIKIGLIGHNIRNYSELVFDCERKKILTQKCFQDNALVRETADNNITCFSKYTHKVIKRIFEDTQRKFYEIFDEKTQKLRLFFTKNKTDNSAVLANFDNKGQIEKVVLANAQGKELFIKHPNGSYVQIPSFSTKSMLTKPETNEYAPLLRFDGSRKFFDDVNFNHESKNIEFCNYQNEALPDGTIITAKYSFFNNSQNLSKKTERYKRPDNTTDIVIDTFEQRNNKTKLSESLSFNLDNEKVIYYEHRGETPEDTFFALKDNDAKEGYVVVPEKFTAAYKAKIDWIKNFIVNFKNNNY